MRVADALVETAVRAGVERVYGVIGDSLNPIGNAIRRNGKLRWVHVRHEEVGAFGAGAQLTGRVTMCAGSAGPGHLHLLNGFCDANWTRAPVFALGSTIASAEVGGSYFQESDPDTVFASCSVYNAACSKREQAPRIFEMAFQHAIARQDVAVVALSGDTAEEDTDLRILAPHRFHPDFAKLAEAYGILGIAVDRHDDVPGALTRAFDHSGPALVSIRTAGLAAGLPQYPSWEQDMGFAKAAVKLVWHGHTEQVVDLAQESIRDIGQLPGVAAPRQRS